MPTCTMPAWLLAMALAMDCLLMGKTTATSLSSKVHQQATQTLAKQPGSDHYADTNDIDNDDDADDVMYHTVPSLNRLRRSPSLSRRAL